MEGLSATQRAAVMSARENRTANVLLSLLPTPPTLLSDAAFTILAASRLGSVPWAWLDEWVAGRLCKVCGKDVEGSVASHVGKCNRGAGARTGLHDKLKGETCNQIRAALARSGGSPAVLLVEKQLSYAVEVRARDGGGREEMRTWTADIVIAGQRGAVVVDVVVIDEGRVQEAGEAAGVEAGRRYEYGLRQLTAAKRANVEKVAAAQGSASSGVCFAFTRDGRIGRDAMKFMREHAWVGLEPYQQQHAQARLVKVCLEGAVGVARDYTSRVNARGGRFREGSRSEDEESGRVSEAAARGSSEECGAGVGCGGGDDCGMSS